MTAETIGLYTATMRSEPLLGDEAVAIGALDAGLGAAYGYPGTPSTEIMERVMAQASSYGVLAHWCSNEKTSFESALGSSIAGKRAMVTMKHVGLNVAADAFISSALVRINGGLVVAVADDPGMHSSQNEQDSRLLADFAKIPCMEPHDPQEAYQMVRLAFDLSEEFETPVLIRLTTRLAHGRGPVVRYQGRRQNQLSPRRDPAGWILMPAFARKRWHALIERQEPLTRRLEEAVSTGILKAKGPFCVVTTGLALAYFKEWEASLDESPAHYHIAAYPYDAGELREFLNGYARVLVLEEGYPFVERGIRGLFGAPMRVEGKMSGEIPMEGELNPDVVRAALGIPAPQRLPPPSIEVPRRPPQLCPGCPHIDTISALKDALGDIEQALVLSDIGCYTLAALPPYSAIHSCVEMGASVGMAKGAAEAGLQRVVALIGDSTFLHSGVPNLVDAVVSQAPMTLIIMDNETVAMTGGQETILPTGRIAELCKGAGVAEPHLKLIHAHPSKREENVAILRAEIDYQGLSVIIAVRQCVEAAKKAKKRGAA